MTEDKHKHAYHPLPSGMLLPPSGSWPNGSGLGVLPSGESNFFSLEQAFVAGNDLSKWLNPSPAGSAGQVRVERSLGINATYPHPPSGTKHAFIAASSVFPTHPPDSGKEYFISSGAFVKGVWVNLPNWNTSIADSMAAPGKYSYDPSGAVKQVPKQDSLFHDFSNAQASQKTSMASGIYDFSLFNSYVHYYPNPTSPASVVIYTPAGATQVGESRPFKIAQRIYKKEAPRFDQNGNPVGSEFFLKEAEEYEEYPDKKFLRKNQRKPFDPATSGIDQAMSLGEAPSLSPRPTSRWLGSDAYPSGNIPEDEFRAAGLKPGLCIESHWTTTWDGSYKVGDEISILVGSEQLIKSWKIPEHSTIKDAMTVEFSASELLDSEEEGCRRYHTNVTFKLLKTPKDICPEHDICKKRGTKYEATFEYGSKAFVQFDHIFKPNEGTGPEGESI